jgi:YVTN family beta-propeller protein
MKRKPWPAIYAFLIVTLTLSAMPCRAQPTIGEQQTPHASTGGGVHVPGQTLIENDEGSDGKVALKLGNSADRAYLPLMVRNHPLPLPDCYPVQQAIVPVGAAPHGVAVNSAAGRLYVANHNSDTLSVINTGTNGLLATIAVGDGPNGVAYNAANGMIYVANGSDNTVTVLRASDHQKIDTITVGMRPNGVAAKVATNQVYVANYGDGTVSVIDAAENRVSQTIPVGAEPSMIAVNPTTGRAYVALHGEGKVAVLNGGGHVTPVDIYDSSGSYGIAVDTLRNLVYVATIDTARIVAIDGSSNTYLGWAQIKRLPGAEPAPMRMIAVNPNIGTSGHIFATTTGEDGGWNKFLLLPKGWPEYFARPHALNLNEPREGIAFEPTTRRVFVTSRSDGRVAVFLDGEPVCASNFGAPERYQITICVAQPDGTCREVYTR